jgi:signal transduction histidine kinase
MSLKKKIIMGFLISSAVVSLLAVFAHLNFVKISREIRFLEFSDTIRSKSLQLRRHEKNFFLYRDEEERKKVHDYLKELKEILHQNKHLYKTETLLNLENKIMEFEQRFLRIEDTADAFQKDFSNLKPSHMQYALFFTLIESTFLESPIVNSKLLQQVFSLKPDSPAIIKLHTLDNEIRSLRKNGEDIIAISKDLDSSAREKVENAIKFSQTATAILFPLFFIVGIGTLFLISHSVVRRLEILTTAVERTGKGDFSSLTVTEKQDEISQLLSKFYKPLPILFSGKPNEVSQLLTHFFKIKNDLLTEQDEVGRLINAFIKMENDLAIRDNEIKKKNEELFQGKKLASIGTLASGVAHELNNPLNNIYLSAQILSKEIDDETCQPIIKETVKDIFSQTLRVKRIVSDLLEFARERTPEHKEVNIVSLINNLLLQMSVSGELSEVKYNLKSLDEIIISADRHLLEQVFINLFTNAVDAMEGRGLLEVEINQDQKQVQIKVSDTGKGIILTDVSRVFDPFFTTKEKGTGLGLAIVYNIIEKHKGKIEVKNRAEKGTTFTITLPVKKSNEFK